MDPAGFSPQWGITPEIEVILKLNLHDEDNAADIVPDSEVTYIGNSLIYVQEAEAVSMCNVTPSVTLSSLILGGEASSKVQSLLRPDGREPPQRARGQRLTWPPIRIWNSCLSGIHKQPTFHPPTRGLHPHCSQYVS